MTDPTTPRRFECKVRLTASGVSVTSPRTGRTLELTHDKAPRRLRGRIVQARATGRPTVVFTLEELLQFKQAAMAA